MRRGPGGGRRFLLEAGSGGTDRSCDSHSPVAERGEPRLDGSTPEVGDPDASEGSRSDRP